MTRAVFPKSIIRPLAPKLSTINLLYDAFAKRSPDWFKPMETQQQLNWPLITPEVCRKTSLKGQHINTLKQMGHNSRIPHRVPLLSANNSKLRLQFTQAHQNWTTEYCKKVVWSDESQFQLQYLDSRVKIWPKQHANMGLRLVWWCSGVGDIFLALLGTNWAHVSMPHPIWVLFLTISP